MCCCVFLSTSLGSPQDSTACNEVAKLTRRSRVLAAEMAATTKGVKGMMSGHSRSVIVLGTAGR